MPIKIPDSLPARTVLENENIFVMTEYRALHQDIRPLKILLLNLMPTKIATETQLLRCLSNTPLQIEVEFLQTSSYTPKNTPAEHLSAFYRTFDEVRSNHYDGMIITGAPVEQMDFEEIDYWEELCEIMEWSKRGVHSVMHICWGAQAGLYYHFGIQKHPLSAKMFGIYAHRVLCPTYPLFRGFNDLFYAPHSRHTEIRTEDVLKVPALEVLSVSDQAGLYIAATEDGRQIFVTGHPEYDADTLATEYFRDVNKGLPIDMPVNYFPDNDPSRPPAVLWRAHAALLYTNWLNYYVYQTTPYDLNEIQ